MKNSPKFTTDQSLNFKALGAYSLADEVKQGCDYIKIFEYMGVTYYLPNDEDWFNIIAVSHDKELAVKTDFCEIDDIAAPYDDYKFFIMPVGEGFELLDC